MSISLSLSDIDRVIAPIKKKKRERCRNTFSEQKRTRAGALRIRRIRSTRSRFPSYPLPGGITISPREIVKDRVGREEIMGGGKARRLILFAEGE